jgi:deazaflavin-dependent oxidoreductase (nitroreductase family)
MPLPHAVARFNRVATNRILGPLAFVARPFAIVVHRGRRSGREHKTPVWAFRFERGIVIALTYGSRSEWVRNVLAEGGATLIAREGSRDLARPRIVHGDDGLRAMPAFMRPALRVLNVDDYLFLEDRNQKSKQT